jgi:hypothetical protein
MASVLRCEPALTPFGGIPLIERSSRAWLLAVSAVFAVATGSREALAVYADQMGDPGLEGGGGGGGGGGYFQPVNPNMYSLWIHGRWKDQAAASIANYSDWSYWGQPPYANSAGDQPRAVNWRAFWDGSTSDKVAMNNYVVRYALDCYCTGYNWCAIATHSTGAAQIGYALALYGRSTRPVTNATPTGTGACNSTGTVQTGWNIIFVDAAGGAEGGSDLADHGDWGTADPLVSDLVTTTMRASYDHNLNRGIIFNMFAGANGAFLGGGIIPGEDDQVIGYHSSGGMSGPNGLGYFNGGSWQGTELPWGFDGASDGHAKWAGHRVAFRDDQQAYKHSNQGTWSGITSLMKPHMQQWAH